MSIDACEERSSNKRLTLRKTLEGEQQRIAEMAQRLKVPGVTVGILYQDRAGAVATPANSWNCGGSSDVSRPDKGRASCL